MMADFNKDNQFVIIMRNEQNILYTQSINMTKKFILSVILYITISIFSIITNIYWLPICVLSILNIIFNIFEWRIILTVSSLNKVNNIIYSDEFSSTFVNNEDIFNLIRLMNDAKGRLSSYINKLTFDFILSSMYIIFIILNILLL